MSEAFLELPPLAHRRALHRQQHPATTDVRLPEYWYASSSAIALSITQVVVINITRTPRRFSVTHLFIVIIVFVASSFAVFDG
jgi:hypothetical protein